MPTVALCCTEWRPSSGCGDFSPSLPEPGQNIAIFIREPLRPISFEERRR
ncbi:MAG: hypothetical protein MZV70_55735 [Desulfobacterales bacterium]|nr:hypothetical protein [Desulfobacterales bacterium]